MPSRWRIFVSKDKKVSLGMKIERYEGLWLPTLMAFNSTNDHLRLDKVKKIPRHEVKLANTRAENTRTTIKVYNVQYDVPLTSKDNLVTVGNVSLFEDPNLRAIVNYHRRGNWYKISPRIQ